MSTIPHLAKSAFFSLRVPDNNLTGLLSRIRTSLLMFALFLQRYTQLIAGYETEYKSNVFYKRNTSAVWWKKRTFILTEKIFREINYILGFFFVFWAFFNTALHNHAVLLRFPQFPVIFFFAGFVDTKKGLTHFNHGSNSLFQWRSRTNNSPQSFWLVGESQ